MKKKKQRTNDGQTNEEQKELRTLQRCKRTKASVVRKRQARLRENVDH